MRKWQLLVCAGLAAALAGCGGGGGGSSLSTSPGGTNNPGGTPSGAHDVTLVNLSFSPATITVAAGTTVTWTWNDCGSDPYGTGTGCVMHQVTFDDGSGISSPTQDTGTFGRTFTTKGTFKYHCAIHGSAMSGQVIVQ